MTDPAALHIPVLPAEVVAALQPAPGRHLLDCTLGLGGHSARLLAAGATVTGIDRDPQARALARERLERDVPGCGTRLTLVAGTFADVAEDLVRQGRRFDGVLADLGVSSLQLDEAARGFSIRSTEPLDLRMDRTVGETALELIDRLDEAALADVLWRYGEERLSRVIAAKIKASRAGLDHVGTGATAQAEVDGDDADEDEVEADADDAADAPATASEPVPGIPGCATGKALAAAVRSVVKGRQERHPALRTFQALRIAVNDELGQLERLLAVLPDLLNPGGRAVLISFHSLEDRLVKQAFKTQADAGRLVLVSRGVVTAGEAELAANPRSAPAKLRIAERPLTAPAPAAPEPVAQPRAPRPGPRSDLAKIPIRRR